MRRPGNQSLRCLRQLLCDGGPGQRRRTVLRYPWMRRTTRNDVNRGRDIVPCVWREVKSQKAIGMNAGNRTRPEDVIGI